MNPIEYELIAEDVAAFTRHVAESVPFYVNARRGAATWGFIFGVIAGGFVAGARDSEVAPLTAFAVMLVVGGLCGFLMWRDYPARCVRVAMAADPPSESRTGYGSHRLSREADGLRIDARHISMNLQWSAFVKFEETALYLFLYVSRVRAFVIPKRGLDAELLRDLAETCQREIAPPKV